MGIFFGGQIRIYSELPHRRFAPGGEEEEIGKLQDATDVVAGAINLGRYGIANCRREWEHHSQVEGD